MLVDDCEYAENRQPTSSHIIVNRCRSQSGYYTGRQGLQASVRLKVQRMCSSRSMSDTERQGLQTACTLPCAAL